ncbi:MAG: TipAS antibiotic-recognition domain-containing protein [Ruminococcus sp.]|nr:MAG: TipAS antibiotic-recognition domain-containing protein [Ruminococcus sp.]
MTEQLTAEFASLMKSGAKPSDSSVQALVQRWQDNITENYYTCTKEILAGLGAMYSGDERFAGNLDRHGKGTAEFIAKAIEIFCK